PATKASPQKAASGSPWRMRFTIPPKALSGEKSMRTLDRAVNERTEIVATQRRATGARPLRVSNSALVLALAGVGLAAAVDSRAQDAAESHPQVPAEQTAAAFKDPSWQVPRLSWGDPDLQGTFTSRDMSGISMDRPQQ